MSEERLRRRVAEIASVDDGMLSDAARERILRRVMMEGPALVHGARWKRRMMFASGPALAVAAGVAFFALHAAEPRPSEVASNTPAAQAPGQGQAPLGMQAAAPAPAKAPACASRPAPTATGFVGGEHGTALDLGDVALAVADPGAAVQVERLEPCRTIIGLSSGRVTVHAKSLGGGELSVHTDGAMVTVRGTVFAVTKDAESLVVEVAEGTVAVQGQGGEHLVHRGERLNVSSVGVAEGALDHERERALRAAVGAPAIVGFDALPTDDSATSGKVEPASPAVAARGAVALRSRSAGAEPAPALLEKADKADKAEPREQEARPEPLAEAESAPAPEAPAKAPDAPAAKPEGPAEWLTQAEQARKAGKFADARTLYRQVAEKGGGATAEAAWVALARMELSLGHPAAAREATKRRQERFGHGTLEPEALWIDVRTYRQTGDAQRARELAEQLVKRWPASPQARAAQQWLSGED